MKAKFLIYGLIIGALSIAIHSCSNDYMEQYEASLELNSNMFRSMVADSSVTYVGYIEQLTTGENSTPINQQRVDIDTYVYNDNHAYTVYINIRYQYSEDLKKSEVLSYSVHVTGRTPLPLLTVDYVTIESIDNKRRFRVRVVGDLDMSPLTESGTGGVIVPFGSGKWTNITL